MQQVSREQRGSSSSAAVIDASIDIEKNGPCDPCRQITLVKNATLFKPGFGMAIGEWTSENGQSFPQIQNIPIGTVAANSGRLFNNDVIVTMGTSSTCNKWSESRITDTLRSSESIEFTACLPEAVSALASKICPKATLAKCTRLQLHDNVLASSNITMAVRKGRCGSFPAIATNTMPAGAVGALLVPGTVLFSVSGEMQCNKQVADVEHLVGSVTSEPIVIDACPPAVVDSDLVCNYICKTPIVPEPQPPIPVPVPNKHLTFNHELWPTVVFDHVDQTNLMSNDCRRVRFTKAKSKYGIDIEVVRDGSSRKFVITHVHEGRGLDTIDLLINDTLSIVNDIPVDDMKDVQALEILLSQGNSSEIWIARQGNEHDVLRTLVRDPHGFGLDFGSIAPDTLSCGIRLPSVVTVDHLMPGLIDKTSNQQMVKSGDVIVSIGHKSGPNLCDADAEELNERMSNLHSVVLEICSAESIQKEDLQICKACVPVKKIVIKKEIVEDKKEEEKEQEEEEEEEKTTVVVVNTTVVIEPKKIPNKPTRLLSESELCEDSGNKWCASKYPVGTGIEGQCVEATSPCPIEKPPLNPNELREYCERNSDDLLHCSRAEPADVPIIPVIPEEQIDPPKTPEPPHDFHPVLEEVGQECRPGGFCPKGDCPKLYEKTEDDYCAPGKDAPKEWPKDPDHICLPGQWCPPGYDCPTGFELQKAGGDGFCFRTIRQGPNVAPEYVGGDFDPYAVDSTIDTLNRHNQGVKSTTATGAGAAEQ